MNVIHLKRIQSSIIAAMTFSIMTLSLTIFRINDIRHKIRSAECRFYEYRYAECRFAECYYAECRYTECYYAECRYTECCYAEYRYAECRYAECRGALPFLTLLKRQIYSNIFNLKAWSFVRVIVNKMHHSLG
jgi:hypothetical protein